jgi:hypothetical protein
LSVFFLSSREVVLELAGELAVPEKQMILRFVPRLAVSTRWRAGRLAETAGGVVAIGAMSEYRLSCECECSTFCGIEVNFYLLGYGR